MNVCTICGTPKKHPNDGCKTCESVFGITPQTQQGLMTGMPTDPQMMSQIPMTPPVPSEKPSKIYKMKFDNGKWLDVYMFASGRICTDFMDTNGALLGINEFTDTNQFKEYVNGIKEEIESEMNRLENFKSVLDELGFEEIEEQKGE